MIIMLPDNSEQTISILPRYQDTYDSVVISIKEDGTKSSETINDATVVQNENYTELTFSATILNEGETYFIEVTNSNNLIYRGKVYATSQSDFTIKHKQSQNNYTQYNVENTYTVID